LELVARRAGGSMRDAQSLLDQLLSFGGDKLTADEGHQLLGTARDERVLSLATAILDHDAPRTLDLLARETDEGLQLGELVDQMIAYWRDLMVLNCSDGTATDLSVAPSHRETVAQQARGLKLDTILAGLDVLSSTRARLGNRNHGRVLVEMALVRLGRLDDLASLSQIAQMLGQSQAAPTVRPKLSGDSRPTAPPEGLKKKAIETAKAAPLPLSG